MNKFEYGDITVIRALLPDDMRRVPLLKRRPAVSEDYPEGTKNNPGLYELPGGQIEPGENPYFALIREIGAEMPGVEAEEYGPFVITERRIMTDVLRRGQLYISYVALAHNLTGFPFRGQLTRHTEIYMQPHNEPYDLNVTPQTPPALKLYNTDSALLSR